MQIPISDIIIGDQYIAYDEHYEVVKIKKIHSAEGPRILVTAEAMIDRHPRPQETIYGPPELLVDLFDRAPKPEEFSS